MRKITQNLAYLLRKPANKGKQLIHAVLSFLKKGNFQKKCRDVRTYYIPFGIFLMHFIVLIGRYLWSFYWVEAEIVSSNPIYLVCFSVIPFIFWAMSTMCETFDTHGWKKLIFMLCGFHAVLTVMQCMWEAAYRYLVIPIMHIRVTETMTPMMVINLARIVLFFSVFLPSFGIIKPISNVVKDQNVLGMISGFKLEDMMDIRPNREVAYDISVMKEVSGFGKKLSILEGDLYTHIMLVGPSGTGKTSTFIAPALIDLIERKCKNRVKRQELLKKLLLDDKAYIAGPVGSPSEYDILAKKGYEKELEDIYRKYPDLGITCVSPNDGIGDAVVRLCEACDIPVNVVDPEKQYEEKVVKHLRLNPFFVPNTLKDKDRIVRIISNANNFSEILLAVNDAVGAAGGDQYFRDLNTSVTSNIATVVMLYASMHNTCATLGVIQRCINDFSLLAPMCREINDKMGLGLKIVDPETLSSEKKSRGRGKESQNFDDIDLDILQKPYHGRRQEDGNGGVAGESGTSIVEALVKGVYDIYRPMRIAVQYVNDDLLINGDKMYDQSRGLRNILNNMISHPDIFNKLNAESDCIDFDSLFQRCEVTVVNSSVRVGGQRGSSALGLFFLLNHCNAVQRRFRDDHHPRETQPHFLITDESAQYLHSWMSQAVNLFRQYKCICLMAFQTLSQLERNASYKDIKDSLLQVGNIIAYGRLGVKEMETFEKLSGTRDVVEFQESLSRSSILAQDPTANVGERRMKSEKANTSGSKARLKRFKEATWFRYVNGNVMPPLQVSLNFAKMDVFDGKGYTSYDWSVYQTSQDEFAPILEEEMGEDAPEPVVEGQEPLKPEFDGGSMVVEKVHKGPDGELVSDEDGIKAFTGSIPDEDAPDDGLPQEILGDRESETAEDVGFPLIKEVSEAGMYQKDAKDSEQHGAAQADYDEREDSEDDFFIL